MNFLRFNSVVARLLVLVAVSVTLSACEGIVHTDSRAAQQARVIVSGTSSVPLTLVTSLDFVAQTNQTTGETTYTVITSKTDRISVPFDGTFAFNGSDRLLVLLSSSDPTATANVRMQVMIDGKSLYDHTASLKDATLRFAYFNL